MSLKRNLPYIIGWAKMMRQFNALDQMVSGLKLPSATPDLQSSWQYFFSRTELFVDRPKAHTFLF